MGIPIYYPSEKTDKSVKQQLEPVFEASTVKGLTLSPRTP